MFFKFANKKSCTSNENHNGVNEKKVCVMVLDVFSITIDEVKHTVIIGIPSNGSISLNDILQHQGREKTEELKVVKLEQLEKLGVAISTVEEYEQVAIWVDKYMGGKIAKGEELVKVS
ncbi:hypothetical protein SAMN02910298_02191 [Pseudobutyrivibrio sp. YE44]|uniref:hypothetical protein n=1 Tax=Pseudobutyrivibrio sp. YE44 TaxID=1520802 RepID=UPI00088CDD65|nr:hypothetical protein [Pseudobutyrivibrio sp. YE44]SDB43764.1 hypothetical protein SAMN02910298_02191 [Pseudobutyrivibrio sp. YE44]